MRRNDGKIIYYLNFYICVNYDFSFVFYQSHSAQIQYQKMAAPLILFYSWSNNILTIKSVTIMSNRKPFKKKKASEQIIDENCYRRASKHLKTFCYSTDYSKSRNSAEVFFDFNKLEDPMPECRTTTKTSISKPTKRRTVKQFRPHTRNQSRSNALQDITLSLNPKRKLTTLQSQILNLSSQIQNSSSLLALRSCTVTSQPLVSLVTSINTKLNEQNRILQNKSSQNRCTFELPNPRDSATALFIMEDIELLEGRLGVVKEENKKLKEVQELREKYRMQKTRLEEILKMEEEMKALGIR